MKTEVFKTDQADIVRAARIIESGGLVAFPTETLYGLGANALDEKAVAEVFELKKRPMEKAFFILISDKGELDKYASNISDEARKLIEKFWPGPLTLVFEKQSIIPDIVTGGKSTVAIRLPRHEVARQLVSEAGVPIIAPSANITDKEPADTVQDVLSYFEGKIDCVLDGGETKLKLHTTIVDTTQCPPKILRQGSVEF